MFLIQDLIAIQWLQNSQQDAMKMRRDYKERFKEELILKRDNKLAFLLKFLQVHVDQIFFINQQAESSQALFMLQTFIFSQIFLLNKIFKLLNVLIISD